MTSHRGNHFSTLAPLKLWSQLLQNALLLMVVLCCLHHFEPPGTGDVSQIQLKCTQLSEALHFYSAFGAWLHRSEEFGTIFFWRTNPGTSNISLPVGLLSSFIILSMQYIWWYESLLLTTPMALIGRIITLWCNCFLSNAAQLLIVIRVSKSAQFYGVQPVVTHCFFQHLWYWCFFSPAGSLSQQHSNARESSWVSTLMCPPWGPYEGDKAWGKG